MCHWGQVSSSLVAKCRTLPQDHCHSSVHSTTHPWDRLLPSPCSRLLESMDRHDLNLEARPLPQTRSTWNSKQWAALTSVMRSPRKGQIYPAFKETGMLLSSYALHLGQIASPPSTSATSASSSEMLHQRGQKPWSVDPDGCVFCCHCSLVTWQPRGSNKNQETEQGVIADRVLP